MTTATSLQTEQFQGDTPDMVALAMSKIHRSVILNPRKSRNKAKFENICESVKKQGVFQPIIVRPSPSEQGKFEIVAGDTRFEANQLAGHATILAVIRNLTDTEAKELAASENLNRSDLSEIEEAWIAADLMTTYHQDHDEVAKRLCWEKSKLKGRLLLSHCIDEVSDALTNNVILLGHAEICANLLPSQQKKVLKRIIDTGWSVKESRERLRKISPVIENASFDTTECKGCLHNSSSNPDLFGSTDTASDSACYNLPCWEKKTKEGLDIIATDTKDEFGTVYFDTEISPAGYVFVTENGDQGVGTSQIEACFSCQHYGAVIETGYKKDGNVLKGTCFNLECHKEKVSAYKIIVKEISASNDSPLMSTGTASSSGTKKAISKKGNEAKPTAVRKGVKRAAFDRFADAAEHTIKQQPLAALAMAALTMIEKVRRECPGSAYAKKASDEAIAKHFPDVDSKALMGDYTLNPQLITTFAEGGSEKLSPLIVELASLLTHKDDADSFEKSTQGKLSLGLLTFYKVNMREWDAVSEKYLNAQTKGVIIQDCKNSGFAECYDEQNEKGAFGDLAKGKLPAIKKAISDSDFDWTGYEPVGFKLTDYIKDDGASNQSQP